MPKKILIVDDELDMRIFLETLFKKGGYETETAENGEEALSHIAKGRPDLITLDILMPKKSGLSFYEAISKDDKLQSIPIIVLSGVTRHAEFFENDDRVGPTEHIEKPVKPDNLLAAAKKLLGE
ncbi:MAG: response regulator [Candidatus Zixiibacteriota bacterium]